MVTNCVYVYFCCIFQEVVDEDRTFSREATFFTEASIACHLVHSAFQCLRIVHNLHCAPTKYIARADQYRITNTLSDHACFCKRDCGTTRRLRNRQRIAQLIPLLTVFGKVDRMWRSSRNECWVNETRQFQRCLPTKTNDYLWSHATRRKRLSGNDIQNIFTSQRLEVETIRSVVVS